MKRVMHIAQSAGGVERYLYTLLKRMDKDKYENILVLSQNYDFEKFKDISCTIERVEMCREIDPIQDIRSIKKIRKLIKQYKPDIIYMHSSKAGALGRIANIGLKNVSIYNAHGWAFNIKCSCMKQKMYALIEKILASLCTKIVAISDYEKESALQRHICKSDKIEVIYNGIDFDEYTDETTIERQKLGIPEDADVVGMVGRLSQQKAPDIFVKSAQLIKTKIPNAYFVIVGDGDEREQTEELIRDSGLSDRFLITGWVKNPFDYIKIFDIAMLLSRWEGFGLVLPEYMLAGKPIVATKVDAVSNIIIDGKNGLLVNMDDYCVAADKVIELHSNTALYNDLKNGGLECVKKKFNAERVVNETESLFDRICVINGDQSNKGTFAKSQV
jgi:glycosyltransferase involved in cell wall biosynthesis